MISRSSVRIRDIVPHDGGPGTSARRASCVSFIPRVPVSGRRPQFRRYGVPSPPQRAGHRSRRGIGSIHPARGILESWHAPEAAARRAVRRRARMARRASRRAVRRPAGRRWVGTFTTISCHSSVLRTVSQPAPIVRPPAIMAQPRWSTVALWVIGLCFLAVAIFVGSLPGTRCAERARGGPTRFGSRGDRGSIRRGRTAAATRCPRRSRDAAAWASWVAYRRRGHRR